MVDGCGMVDGRAGGWMVGWIDGWMDRWVGGWIDGWVDGSMDGTMVEINPAQIRDKCKDGKVLWGSTLML